MTRARIFSANDYAGIKAASRRSLARSGARLEELNTRVNAPMVSKALNPNLPEIFPAADTVVDLDAEAGEPHGVRHMARLLGYELVRLPRFAGEGAGVAELCLVLRKAGRVTEAAALALENGQIDGEEPQQLIERLRALQAAGAEAIAVLERLRAGAGKGRRR